MIYGNYGIFLDLVDKKNNGSTTLLWTIPFLVLGCH